MKKHRFTKFLLALLLIGGAAGLTACQSTNKSEASVPANQCEVKIYTDEKGNRTALVTIGIYNNTIYNVKQIEVDYEIYGSIGLEPIYRDSEKLDIFVRHGVSGWLTYSVNIKDYPAAVSTRITAGRVTAFQSLWETYVAPFVVMIILGVLALIFAAVDIFRNDWTKETLKEALAEKLSLYLVIFGLTVLICLIPLMFSSWVVTCILVGGFLAVALLTAAMTAIKVAQIKKQ